MLLASIVRETKAAAAAEMALMLPLLVAIMFAGFEGGAYLWTEHKVIKGVREGARYAGRQPFDNFDCATETITNGAVVTNIQNLTRTGTADGTGTLRISGWTNAQVTVSIECDAATTTGLYKQVTGGAPVVTVDAEVPYPSLFASLGFDTDGAVVQAQSQAAVMGL